MRRTNQRTTVHSLLVGVTLTLSPAAGLAQQARSPAEPADTNPATVVRAYVDAFNSKNIDAVIARLAPDFVWLTITGDSVTVEARGPAAVREQLTAYFKSLPSARSEVDQLSVLGPWVSARERAHWTGRNGPTSQASLSVYEVRRGLIQRVWYYPVVH